jgi:hypothetical protein
MHSLKTQSRGPKPLEQIRKGKGSSIGWENIFLEGKKLLITLEVATFNFDDNTTCRPHQPD